MSSAVRQTVAKNIVMNEEGWVLVKGGANPVVFDCNLSDLQWLKTLAAIGRHLNHPQPERQAAMFMQQLKETEDA